MKRHKCRAPERGLQPASASESEMTSGNHYKLREGVMDRPSRGEPDTSESPVSLSGRRFSRRLELREQIVFRPFAD